MMKSCYPQADTIFCFGLCGHYISTACNSQAMHMQQYFVLLSKQQARRAQLLQYEHGMHSLLHYTLIATVKQ